LAGCTSFIKLISLPQYYLQTARSPYDSSVITRADVPIDFTLCVPKSKVEDSLFYDFSRL